MTSFSCILTCTEKNICALLPRLPHLTSRCRGVAGLCSGLECLRHLGGVLDRRPYLVKQIYDSLNNFQLPSKQQNP